MRTNTYRENQRLEFMRLPPFSGMLPNLFRQTETVTTDAFSGTNALALTANGSGVSQSFAVTPGLTYTPG